MLRVHQGSRDLAASEESVRPREHRAACAYPRPRNTTNSIRDLLSVRIRISATGTILMAVHMQSFE